MRSSFVRRPLESEVERERDEREPDDRWRWYLSWSFGSERRTTGQVVSQHVFPEVVAVVPERRCGVLHILDKSPLKNFIPDGVQSSDFTPKVRCPKRVNCLCDFPSSLLSYGRVYFRIYVEDEVNVGHDKVTKHSKLFHERVLEIPKMELFCLVI